LNSRSRSTDIEKTASRVTVKAAAQLLECRTRTRMTRRYKVVKNDYPDFFGGKGRAKEDLAHYVKYARCGRQFIGVVLQRTIHRHILEESEVARHL